MNEQIFRQIIDSWAEERENWQQYEYHIKNLIIIRKNVDEIDIYSKRLIEEDLNKLYTVYLPLYKLFENEKIDFTDYSDYSIKHENGVMTDDQIKKELVAKNKIIESDYITWDEIPKTEREQYNADWFLNKNKEKYAKITGDDSIRKIIDLMVETFQKTNASKSAFGAPKTIVNRNNLKSILKFFQILQQGNPDKTDELISQIRDMNKIGKEVFGYYNLANNNAFIYNSRVDNVFKLLFDDYKENQSLSYIEEYFSYLRDEYKKEFSNNLHPEKLNSLIKNIDLDLTDISGKNLSLNLQIDQMIYNYDEKYLKSERKKIKTGSISVEKTNNSKIIAKSLNTILYGPPGTGKTYYTINRAISIIDGIDSEEKLEKKYNTREDLKKHFVELLITDWDSPTGQIGFITFHQSMSYEDFIEGIKPDLDKGEGILSYDIIPGIFRSLAQIAEKNFNNSKKSKDDLVKERTARQLIKEFAEYVENSILQDDKGVFQINQATHIMEVEEDAFRYTGENWVRHSKGIRMKLQDLVEFYNNDIKERKDIRELKNISSLAKQHATYYFIVYQKLKEFEKNNPVQAPVEDSEKLKKYVLIIDEINRGNVSQIFGELITLIEEDKRAGNPEAIEVTLPYSKEKFTVPPNLYIIGTMNTADRSVEALDTALRRRFSFEFMPPRYDLDELDVEVSGIKIRELLKTINERITYLLDEDHQIGHSYFMGIKENETEDQRVDELYSIFRNKIIPLLKEYFYNDYGKIQLILGREFVETIANDKIPEFADSDADILEREQYRIKIDDKGFEIINTLKSILKKKTDQGKSDS